MAQTFQPDVHPADEHPNMPLRIRQVQPHQGALQYMQGVVLHGLLRIPMIVTDDSGIVTAQSGHRDRCRVVRDIACQANCTIA